MSVEKNVPEIRFKGFSEEWANLNIGDIFQVTSGATPLRSDARFFENADVSWVKTTDLNNGVILKTEEKISQIAVAETSVKILPKGTVFVAMYGGFNQIGRTGLLETEATCNQALSAIYPNDKVVPYYLLTYLNLNVDAWKDLAASSRKDPNITKSDVLAFPFLYPSIQEQTAIGNTFQKLDSLIKQHQQKHDKLSSIKKAMLEKMFPKQGETIPEIRFEGFSGEWEEKTLGELGETFTGLAGKTKHDFGHGQARFVTYMNVFANAISNESLVEPVEIDEGQNEVVKGDVFFTTSSETPEEVGMSSIWMGEAKNVYLNSFCFGYRPKQKIDSVYLAYMLRASSFRKQVIFLAQGVSRYNISKTKVMDIKTYMPSLLEQEKIGNYFQKLDALINQHQHQITKLGNIKQACLSKMFV